MILVCVLVHIIELNDVGMIHLEMNVGLSQGRGTLALLVAIFRSFMYRFNCFDLLIKTAVRCLMHYSEASLTEYLLELIDLPNTYYSKALIRIN